MVQGLGFCALTTQGLRSIPSQRTNILQAPQCGEKKTSKELAGMKMKTMTMKSASVGHLVLSDSL